MNTITNATRRHSQSIADGLCNHNLFNWTYAYFEQLLLCHHTQFCNLNPPSQPLPWPHPLLAAMLLPSLTTPTITTPTLHTTPPLTSHTHHLREDLRLGWLTVLSSVKMVEQELAFLISTGEENPARVRRALWCRLRPEKVRERPEIYILK